MTLMSLSISLRDGLYRQRSSWGSIYRRTIHKYGLSDCGANLQPACRPISHRLPRNDLRHQFPHFDINISGYFNRYLVRVSNASQRNVLSQLTEMFSELPHLDTAYQRER